MWLPDMRIDQANVGTSRPDAAPAALSLAAPGAKTEVNLESLEITQKWLLERAAYLGQLFHALPAILEKIDGPGSAGSPTLGGFTPLLAGSS